MTNRPDLGPAAEQMTSLLRGIRDDQLDAPTPCPDYSLGDLVDHIGGLAVGFTWAATKEFPPEAGARPSGDASRLPADWRDQFAERLATMAEVWRAPEAWQGMTQAGGVDLPGEVTGLIAIDELVVHGWDVAVATGQEFAADETSIRAALEFVVPLAEPEAAQQRSGVFGPVVPVPDPAPSLDRLLGLAGRDPDWSPAG
jgi:uncharacterized protein (TIGR03086 family)